MNHDTSSKMDLLNSKCDDVIGSMRIKTPLAYKGYTAYASFHPPPSDMDSTNENTFTYDQQYWLPIPTTARLDRQTVMTKHHFVAEPDWLPPVQTVQYRVPRPHSRGVKLRSVEAIVNDNQRQKAAAAALANEEKGQQATIKMPPRQQPTPRQPPPPKSKVLDILDEIKAVSRNSSSNSSTPNKFSLTPTTTTPTQNGNMKKQQPSIPSKRPSDAPNRQSLKKRTQSSTAPPQTSTSTPRSASRPLVTEKTPSKTPDVVTKSRPKSSDTNLDLFMTKQFLINDLNDPAATRHLEDLSRLNVIRKRPVLRIHIKMKLPKIKNESRSKEVNTKPKNDTQASPVITGDASTFNLPTGTIPTEFIRSMKIRKKSKSDQATASSSPVTAPTTTSATHKTGRSHMVELEEGETISPSPSPRRQPSLSPERNTTKSSSSKRHRDKNGAEDHEQQSRRNKTSRKEVSVPLSSSSSASSSTSTTSRYLTAHDNGDDRQRHDSPTTTSSKSLVRKDRYSATDDDRRSASSKRLERTISNGDDDRRRSKYSSSSSSRHSRDEETSSRHRSSQRSSGSRQRRSSRSMSRSRSPNRRSSSSSSHTRSSSQDKHRRHAPTAGSLSSSSSSSSANKDRSTVLNGPTTPKDVRIKESVPTPTAAILSPAIQAIKKESKESTLSPAIKKEPKETTSSTASPAIKKAKDSRSTATTKSTTSNQKIYPPATAEDAETQEQYRIFYTMFNKLALAYKRRGDHSETENNRVLDHMHAFMNYALTFYFQDKVHNTQVDKNWGTLLPFSSVLLKKLSSLKNKEKQYGVLYGLCLRMDALVHFYIFHRCEQFAKPKINRLCEKEGDGFDDTKRMEYAKVVHKVLQDHETAYSTLRESDRYISYEGIQAKFPVSFENVCVRGELGAGIVLGGEAGVTVGPMFPLVPYARLHHAAIMAKCLLQEFVDKEGIEFCPITETEDYM